EKFLQLKINSAVEEKNRFLFSRNPNFSDLGFTINELSTEESIKSSILKVDNMFNFVMITELWEESLVLLKRKLCLSVEDIVVFDANVDPKKRTKTPDHIIPMIIKYNYADYKLYEYFYKKLKNEVKSIKDSEIKELRKAKSILETQCIEGRVKKKSYGSKLYLGYNLKTGLIGNIKQICEALVRSEIEYVDFFRNKL
ncbi:hypothetical protein MXB_5434, partial [Myxobolus squamalis]